MSASIIIYSLWILSEVVLNRFMRSRSSDKKKKDKGSLSFIWITIIITVTIGTILSHISKFLINGSSWPTIGLAVIITGMLLRFYSIGSLGKFFTVDVTIRENHTLKKTGIYRIIRHPSYLGSLLSFIGYGISLNNWISLLIISIPVTLAFLYRIKVEEEVLLEQFGAEYRDYMKDTYRLLPGIY